MSAPRRKTVYARPSRSAKSAAPVFVPTLPRATVVTINPAAQGGRPDLAIGDRVVIAGSGLYVGESATVEAMGAAMVPTAHVRTDSGHARLVRQIDLTPLAN